MTDFQYKISPERLQQIADSPSGWVPQMEPPPELPFYIRRTRMNDIPVYCEQKGQGGKRFITSVKHVQGDLKELERCIRLRIGDNHHYQINELTQTVRVK